MRKVVLFSVLGAVLGFGVVTLVRLPPRVTTAVESPPTQITDAETTNPPAVETVERHKYMLADHSIVECGEISEANCGIYLSDCVDEMSYMCETSVGAYK